MRIKSLLIIGLLLLNGASSHAPGALQAVRVPHEAEAASQKKQKTANFTLSKEQKFKLYTRYIAATKVKKKPVVKKKKVRKLLPVVDHKDIKLKHRIIADEVLRSMPKKCQNTLKNFYVRYDNPKQRGLGGKTTIILSGNIPDDEFRALMIHELGHVFDLNNAVECLSGTKDSGISHFRDGDDLFYQNDPSISFYSISWINEKTKRPGARPDDFVTGYAAWDVFEDFAESMTYFITQNDVFLERAQTNPILAAKYNWFRIHMFPEGKHIAVGEPQWNGTVPWDATKLHYKWQGHTHTHSH